MTLDSGIQTSKQDAIVTVTLSRPEVHNALSLSTWRTLTQVFREFASEQSIRVIVLRGAGERAFSAGADIREFPAVRMGQAAASAYDRAVADALLAVQQVPQPVIVVIQGIAVGGGLELAVACDIRIASEEARLGLPLGRLGVMPGLTEVEALLRLMPPGKVIELVFRGELLSATEALQWGLVTEVVPAVELENCLTGWIRRLLAMSPDTLRATKAVTRLARIGATEGDATYQELLGQVYSGPAFQEGVQAFLGKRQPRFP